MSQVRPDIISLPSLGVSIDHKFCSNSPSIVTVWKKSLVFNGKGFTVFDSCGNLVFRVDNYASNTKKEIFLMDHTGKVLITMRRKGLNKWEAFRGEVQHFHKPIFTITNSSGLFSKKVRANVFVTGSFQSRHCNCQIKGCSTKPSCTIANSFGDIITEVKRKNVMVGDDVLSMVVQPETDQAFAMGLIISFNQII